MNHTRNLLLSVLSTTATKREARQYITRYVGTGTRISVIRVAGTDGLSSLTPGLARTCAFMRDLGAHPVILLDGSPQISSYLAQEKSFRELEQQLATHADQFGKLIGQHHQEHPALTLGCPFELSSRDGLITRMDELHQPLSMGHIPVLLPILYDRDTADTKMYDSFKATKAVVEALMASKSHEVDKLIFVDPLGGLPSQRRKDAAHVLVNLQQEYGDISAELMATSHSGNRTAHLQNLRAMNEILGMLPNHVSGIITTPQAAGSVLDRNPIIYNILTDRPLISPSLPVDLQRTQLSTSVLRRGLAVYSMHSAEGMDIRRQAKVGNVNLTKLTELINDSFGRELDLEHYLTRIDGRVAALIVVGDYDGAAIITWEKAPKTGRNIAYLDKFAVRRASQGAQGVADIMLIQMIRRLFPDEVIWRSRKDNPVNKWYFERARGHLRIPDSNWVMFWISDMPAPPLDEYVSVCASIEPSLR